MTDQADVYIERAVTLLREFRPHEPGCQLAREILVELVHAVEHLRTTTTAPARTEGTGCAKCPEAAEEARRTGASVKCYGCSLYIAPLSTATARTEEDRSFADPTGTYADKRGTYAGQVEPSDALVEINQLCRVLAGRSDLDESGLYESAARVRDLLKAAGRSSSARELAEMREKVKAWEPVVARLPRDSPAWRDIPAHLRPGEGKV